MKLYFEISLSVYIVINSQTNEDNKSKNYAGVEMLLYNTSTRTHTCLIAFPVNFLGNFFREVYKKD